MEIIIVGIIIGIAAVIAIPNYGTYINASRARDAQNTLLAIYAGQLNHKAKQQNFCAGNPCFAGSTDNCVAVSGASAAAGIASCLGVSILINNINYSCTDPGGGSFKCTADVGPGLFKLTLNNAQINLAAGGNPVCTDGTITCPAF